MVRSNLEAAKDSNTPELRAIARRLSFFLSFSGTDCTDDTRCRLEGAKIMKFVEEGVMDAVSKGYLRSFMFIIFLDKGDPQK